MNVFFLGAIEIIHMHRLQVEEFGGSHGIRDIKLLDSAIAEPQATFDGEFLYKDLIEMAAAYMFHLIKNHPFIDGNKRIGVITAFVFLEFNNVVIDFTQEQLFTLAYGVADSSISKEQLIEILRKHVR